MAFTLLKKGTLISHSEINDNFSFIVVGDMLPRQGDSLSTSDATSNLGAQTTRWNKIYTQNLNISGSISSTNKDIMYLLSELTLSAPASSIEFTGFDTSLKEYSIIGHIENNSALSMAVSIVFNNDSDANYGYLQLKYTSITADSVTSNVEKNSIEIGTIDSVAGFSLTNVFFKISLLNNTPEKRVGYIHSVFSLFKAEARTQYNTPFIWNNTSNTLTSIKIIFSDSDAATNTNIQLWGRS